MQKNSSSVVRSRISYAYCCAHADEEQAVAVVYVDFISRLPLNLAKYVLGFLSFADLEQAVLVSDSWRRCVHAH
jgi:hypothetical protein